VGADASDDLAQIRFGLDAIELGRANERIEQRRPLAAGVAAGEQPVLSSQRYRSGGILGRIVADLEPTVVEVAGQRAPSRARVADGAGEVALARYPLQLCIEPGCQLVEPWPRMEGQAPRRIRRAGAQSCGDRDLCLPVERKVIAELGRRDVCEEARAGHAARDRQLGHWRLHHRLAFATRAGRTHVAHHFEATGDVLQHFSDVFANGAQLGAAAGLAHAGRRMHDVAARQLRRQLATLVLVRSGASAA
jgi:hypothetical protein